MLRMTLYFLSVIRKRYVIAGSAPKIHRRRLSDGPLRLRAFAARGLLPGLLFRMHPG